MTTSRLWPVETVHRTVRARGNDVENYIGVSVLARPESPTCFVETRHRRGSVVEVIVARLDRDDVETMIATLQKIAGGMTAPAQEPGR